MIPAAFKEAPAPFEFKSSQTIPGDQRPFMAKLAVNPKNPHMDRVTNWIPRDPSLLLTAQEHALVFDIDV